MSLDTYARLGEGGAAAAVGHTSTSEREGEREKGSALARFSRCSCGRVRPSALEVQKAQTVQTCGSSAAAAAAAAASSLLQISLTGAPVSPLGPLSQICEKSGERFRERIEAGWPWPQAAPWL